MTETPDNLAAYEAAETARNEAEAALRRERVELTARIEKIDELLPPVVKKRRHKVGLPPAEKKPRKPRRALGSVEAA